MDSARSPIFIISGTPGSGKTSVSAALMRRFPHGVHIPLDDVRDWVVSGQAPPVPNWTHETTRQFHLARQAAAATARLYADAGFAVALDDVIFPVEAQLTFVTPLSAHRVHKILLKPDVQVALHRNATRTNKTFDTSLLFDTVRQVHQSMPESLFIRAGWIVIDSTNLTLEATVDEILSRI